jgi:hypothetical protein
MARQPSMGLGLLFPRLRGLFCAFEAVRDRLTGRDFQLDPEPSGSQSGDLGEKWPLNFAYKHY